MSLFMLPRFAMASTLPMRCTASTPKPKRALCLDCRPRPSEYRLLSVHHSPRHTFPSRQAIIQQTVCDLLLFLALRLNDALMKVDATYAKASVATDREYILNVVQREMGIDQFNEYIRDGIRREYKNISKLAAFGGSPLLWGRDL